MQEFYSLDVRPYQLMCVVCRLGSKAAEAYHHTDRLDEILAASRKDPGAPLTLRCNADSVYAFQNCGTAYDTPEGALFNKRRDLTILQKLSLVPGDTRPAYELFTRVLAKIEGCTGVCGFEGATSAAWQGCPLATSGNYERGRVQGIDAVIPPRPAAEKAEAKEASAAAMYDAPGLEIRPHHLMCITCFHKGRRELAPIAEDNLFEAIDIVQKSPDIPVTLVPGCCMICPPCSRFSADSERCIGGNAMALRDEKKDLDTLQLLGLAYGDTLPARELFGLLYARVAETTQVCGYGDGKTYSYEWTVCGGPDGAEGYRQARASGLGGLTGER